MVHIVDTAFSYGRTLTVCLFLQESTEVKESSLHEIWNANTAFLLGGADFGQGVPTIHWRPLALYEGFYCNFQFWRYSYSSGYN